MHVEFVTSPIIFPFRPAGLAALFILLLSHMSHGFTVSYRFSKFILTFTSALATTVSSSSYFMSFCLVLAFELAYEAVRAHILFYRFDVAHSFDDFGYAERCPRRIRLPRVMRVVP